MTDTYNVDVSDQLRDKLPSEVTVESQSELDRTISELQTRIGNNHKLSVDRESKTIHALEFIVN